MIFIWGRKITRHSIGYVADFCPICRSQQAFKLVRVGSVGHIYYLSLGQGDLVGYERRCLACGTTFSAELGTYACVSKSRSSLAELARTTFPGFAQAYQERLALEAQVVQSPAFLSPEERKQLIRNPFLLLSPAVERRFKSLGLDLWSTLAIFSVPAVMALTAMATQVIGLDPAIAGLIGLCLWLALVVWQIFQSHRRFMRRKIVPPLAKALKPLRPRPHELKAVLAELQRSGRKLHLEDLQAALTEPLPVP